MLKSVYLTVEILKNSDKAFRNKPLRNFRNRNLLGLIKDISEFLFDIFWAPLSDENGLN